MSQGKGSKRRLGKPGAYARGYDAIDWSKGRKPAAPRKATRQWHCLTEGNPLVEALPPKECASLDEMVSCGGEDHCANPPTEEHTCPYQVEINGNEEFTCTCCDECRMSCAWAV